MIWQTIVGIAFLVAEVILFTCKSKPLTYIFLPVSSAMILIVMAILKGFEYQNITTGFPLFPYLLFETLPLAFATAVLTILCIVFRRTSKA